MIRKHILKKLMLGLLPFVYLPAQAQSGLHVQNNGYLVMQGNSHLVLNDCDLIQNGNFNAGAGTVLFSGGTAPASINGASTVSFNNLSIDKTGYDVTLNTNITVGANLNMISRHIELNTNDIDLGTNGSIIGESNTSYITGLAGGNVLKTASLNNPNAVNPGNIGLAITATGNLGNTLISRGHVQQTGTSSGIGIARYFDVVPSGTNSGLNASLDFRYLDHELMGINEPELSMTARDVPMGYWGLIGVDGLDMPNNVLTKNAIDTLGRFTLTSSQNNTLPVMLLSFYGRLVNGQALVNWEVANELGVIGYDIEKSADGISFGKLGAVKPKGTQDGKIRYQYADASPYKGSTYYRLKIYDNMGKGSFSKSIRVDLNEAYTLSVYPNPVTDKVNVEFNCTELKPMQFKLLDAQGRIVSVKDIMPVPGANRVEWNISGLPAASYYLQLHGLSDSPIKISKIQ
jgi:hypothetical protein